MLGTTRLPLAIFFVYLSVLPSFAKLAVASDVVSPAPKVSSFAPADDLVDQAEKLLKTLCNTVADEEEYKISEGKVNRDAGTLAVVALALGLHDQANKYQSSAGAILRAAQAAAATKDYESAKKAVAALAEVVARGGSADGELKWAPVASLPDLMKQVPLIHSKLNLSMKGKNFSKKAKDNRGRAAVIAVIAQGTLSDLSATKTDEEARQWRKFSEAMRDDAAAVNAAIRRADEPAAAEAMKKLQQSCEDCHAVFKPDVVASGNGK